MLTGFQTIVLNGKSQISYFNNNGMVYGEQLIDGKYYYFDNDGARFSGLITLNNNVNYFDENGQKCFGDKLINGNWYYFDNTGAMQTSFVTIDGKSKYYDEYGRLVFGTFKQNKVTYETDDSGNIIKTYWDDVKYYNQYDPRWAYIYIGSDTIGNTGCMPTTITAVVNTLKNTNYTPEDIARLMHNNGYYNAGISGVASGSNSWRFVANHFGLSYKNGLSYNDIITQLQQGKLVTAVVGYSRWCPYRDSSHQIFMFGLDSNGYTTVYDPYNRSQCGKFQVMEVWNARSSYSSDCWDNGPFFAIGYLLDKAQVYIDLSIYGDSHVSDQFYTGSEINPTVVVSNKHNNAELKKNVDYTIEIVDNIAVGKGKIIVRGIGKFFGEFVSYFDIVKDIVNDGTYEINSSKDPKKVIDVVDGSYNSGSKLQIYDKNNTQAQQFVIHREADGYYTIQNVKSGYYLLTSNHWSGLSNGFRLYQGNKTNDNRCKFMFKKDASGHWVITSVWDNKFVIDLNAGSVKNGTAIQMYMYNGSTAQMWDLVGVRSQTDILDELAKNNYDAIQDGNYYISSLLNNKVVDVSAGSNKNGANIQVYEYNNSDAQNWIIEHVGNYVVIRNVASGKVLDVTNGRWYPGSNIQLYEYNGSRSQQWIAVKTDKGYKFISALNSLLYLDTSNGNVQLGLDNSSLSQYWYFMKNSDEYLNELKSKDTLISSGTYDFMNSSLILDVSSGSIQNGANVQVYKKNGSGAQIWMLERQSNGYFVIRNYQSGKVLDILNGNIFDGANIQQYDYNGSKGQLWCISYIGNGYKVHSVKNPNYVLSLDGTNVIVKYERLNSKNVWDLNETLSQQDIMDQLAKDNANVIQNGKYEIHSVSKPGISLDVNSASKDNYGNVIGYNSNNNMSQGWMFEQLDSGYWVIRNVNSGKALDVSGGARYSGVNVQQYDFNNSRAQLWVVVQTDKGLVIKSALASYLNLYLNGSNAILYSDEANTGYWNVSKFISKRDKLDSLANENKDAIGDGNYTIHSSKNSNYVLDAANGGVSNGTNVQLYVGNNSDAQGWTIMHDSNGYVIFKNIKSGKVLDVSDGVARNEKNVQLYDFNDSYAQKWIVKKTGNGFVILSALDSNYVLDLSSGLIRNTQNIQLYTSNSSIAQSWMFTTYVSQREQLDSLAQANKDTVNDGNYVIHSSKNSNYVLDAANGGVSNGTNVQLYVGNNSDAQGWTIMHDSNGYVIFKNIKSGKVLDVSDGVARNEKNVQLYTFNDSYAQKWIVKKTGNGFVILSALDSNYVLDLSSGLIRNTQNIQLYTSNSSIAQSWMFTTYVSQRDQMDSLAQANKDVIHDGTFEISSAKNSNYAVDVSDGSVNNGANVQLYISNNTEAQKWIISHDSKGYVTFTNAKSGKVLDVSDGTAKNGKNVHQYASNGSYAQKWIIMNTNTGYKIVSALNSDYVLDLANGTIKNSGNIQIYTDNSSVAQRWLFKEC